MDASLVGLTQLRALAIALVFLYHYQSFAHPAWIERVGAFGWTGVDLFFVLSGFLISRQLFRPFSIRTFYFKRSVRILPAYLFVLAAYVLFPSIHEREALPPTWRFLTFTQNFGLDFRCAGTFSHAWSLCIEEQFYLVLPLVFLIFPARCSRWLLPILVAAGLVARTLLYLSRVAPLSGTTQFDSAWYEWIYYPTWSRLDGLLVGIALAALYELRPATAARLIMHDGRLVVLAVVSWIGASLLLGDPTSLTGSVLAFPAIAVVYGFLVCAALSPTGVLARSSSRVTRWLATLSYALYLTHKACIHVVQRELARLGLASDGNVMFECCVAACVSIALVLHLAIERPLLQWRDRVLIRSKRTVSAP